MQPRCAMDFFVEDVLRDEEYNVTFVLGLVAFKKKLWYKQGVRSLDLCI